MITNIMEFQSEEATDFWSEPLFHFFPKLDRDYTQSLSAEEKRTYIENCLRAEYPEIKNTIDQKIPLYSKYWQQCEKQICAALSDAFEIDCSKLFENMICNITMNPNCPRFLKKQSFDIFYLNSDKGGYRNGDT